MSGEFIAKLLAKTQFDKILKASPENRLGIIIRLIILGCLLWLFSRVILAIKAKCIELWKKKKNKKLLVESKGYMGGQKRHKSDSNKYHYPTCKFIRGINQKSLIVFNSAKEAQTLGYVPCKVCKPPVND